MNNNTISGFHIAKRKGDFLKLRSAKLYNWHIPQYLRDEPICKGDIVLVKTKHGSTSVLVMDVFREEFEETNRKYKRIVAVIQRAPKKQPVNQR